MSFFGCLSCCNSIFDGIEQSKAHSNTLAGYSCFIFVATFMLANSFYPKKIIGI